MEAKSTEEVVDTCNMRLRVGGSGIPSRGVWDGHPKNPPEKTRSRKPPDPKNRGPELARKNPARKTPSRF